jgi:ABC-2 type transport system ATP-binding protein
MTDTMIEARDLTKRYDRTLALDKVSLSVPKGQVLGFLGPNGAGKTTTMRILTCFTAPTDGGASINGCDVLEDPIGARRAIGYLPESNPLYPDMLAVEYLRFAADVRGIDKSEAKKRIKIIVEETGLGDHFDRPIRTLSKGYRQRVGLAQALIHQPPILILDEPMSGLDPNQAVEIRDLIREIGRERTVVLSTHNLAEVRAACDRVVIISKGRIVADDTPDHLRERAGKRQCFVAVRKAAPEADLARKCETAFAGLPGVERVRSVAADNDAELAYELSPRGDDDLRATVFRACVDHGLTLVGLRHEGQNLEQIFRELTTGSDAGTTGNRTN